MKRHLLPLIGLLVLLFAPGGRAAPAPTTKPSAPSRPATAPSKPSAKADPKAAQRLSQLTRKSIQLLQQKKPAEAEPVLLQAVALDPGSIVNLYNLACCKALRGQPDAALDYLEKAAEAGYTDFTHLGVDADLISLRALPRYRDLLAKKPVYLRKAADRALAELRNMFGDGYLYEVDEQDKLIFATNTDAETLAALKKSLQAQARSQWAQLFEHKPDEYVRVVLPSPADYKDLIRMPGVGGIYMDTYKMLIAQRLGQVMTHEFTHALHAADRAPLEQDHPIWLAEGLASMYEAATWQQGPGGDVLVPQDNYRVHLLQNAATGNKLIPLEKLLTMTQPEFVAKANLAYGQASSLLLYLYEQKLLRPFYDAYKKGYDDDATGRAALERVTGKRLPELERAWMAWMRARTPPPKDTGPDGAFLGAQFAQSDNANANDGLRFGPILPTGPAAAAGLRAGDVLVGIGGHEVHDFQSFGPTMSLYKPGERVVLRIRRDGAYLDVPVLLARRSELLTAIASPKAATGGGKPATRPATRPATQAGR